MRVQGLPARIDSEGSASEESSHRSRCTVDQEGWGPVYPKLTTELGNSISLTPVCWQERSKSESVMESYIMILEIR